MKIFDIFAEKFAQMTVIDEKSLLEMIERGLASIEYPAVAPRLYKPVEYTLAEGGKRLRPLLALAAAQAFCGAADCALEQALAVEMFHNFTLIHDDVMDRSAMRRGRPTVYKRWGSVQAILSGDALLTLATARVTAHAGEKAAQALDIFNRTALEVYEGQQLDMDFETRRRVRVAEYMEMIRLKTSVLLGCACEIGALMGGADADSRRAMYDYAVNLGIAFQLRDDWLDTFGDPAVFGKPIGGDIVNRKKTWLFLQAMAKAPAPMERALLLKQRPAMVRSVTRIYKVLGLSEQCDALIADYVARAVEALSRAGLEKEYYEWFAALAHRLCSRMK